VVNGSDTKMATTIIQTNAAWGRPSQSAWLLPNDLSTPTSFKNRLITPLFGSSAHRNISVVINTDAAHGAINAHRVTRRPGNTWLNSWANPRERTIVTHTTTTTQIAVRHKMPGRSGSSNRFLKFFDPAGPSKKPFGLKC
jgi:hypothetical protein